ncbi:MAG TPA: TIGR03118 family protein [Candidatus Acidoferrales bacterium]|nr:TIGR03118 family protein [Candidatus Acidoferrales bacterium]
MMQTNQARKSAARGLNLALTASIATLACLSAVAKDNDRGHDDEDSQYRQINLVSDVPAFAQIQDTNLVNAWGLSFGAGGPFWSSDNGTHKATLYAVTNDAAGAPHVARNARVVTIPGDGSVSGNVNNTSPAFNADAFIFASEDGTISGWRPALGNAAEVLTARPTAVYKGLTIATNSTGTVLLAANFAEGTIDEYNSTMQLIGQFSDQYAPAGYAPFNVMNIAGTVFVTYAKQDAAKHDDVPGRGHGLINVFNPLSSTFQRFATGTDAGGNIREFNSPWGMALAPSTFGTHADQLLVANLRSGTIMSFEADGGFRGLLKSTEECPVIIDGLWGLSFGASGSDGVPTDLYFTAGPNSEAHGLFGVIQLQNDSDDDKGDKGNKDHKD